MISASVLSFEKKLVSSDGYFYGTRWENRLKEASPLKLIVKSVRGTISNRLKPALQNNPIKINAEVEKPNLQRVDVCSLDENQDTLKLCFTLKILGDIAKPSACNCEKFKKSYVQAVKQYIEQEGFSELAKRYAINIANARFLWRNRVGAENIEVIVNAEKDNKKWEFNAKQYGLSDFTVDDAQINELADYIAKALSGNSEYLFLKIEAYAKVGYAQEVYPSEELVLDKGKGKGKKSKVLYSINEIAAMHSQKISNALRTIDTWYPDFDAAEIGPIAVEVYGAVTNLGKAYRTPKHDFYTLFDHFATGGKLANKEQEHYVMAVLVRGGVFGQKQE